MNSTVRRSLWDESAFTLLELMVVLLVVATVTAMSVPVFASAMRQFTLNSTVRNLAADIRQTRYAAVAKNRTMTLRFDCPAPNQYRMIEWTGDPNVDTAADRCALAAFPYPDPNPGVLPDADGPIVFLPTGLTFVTASTLSFDAFGRVGGQVTIGVTNGTQSRNISVLASGRVIE